MLNKIEVGNMKTLSNIDRKALGRYFHIGNLFDFKKENFYNFSIFENFNLEYLTFIDINKSEIIILQKRELFKEKVKGLEIPYEQAIFIINQKDDQSNIFYDYVKNKYSMHNNSLQNLFCSIIFKNITKKQFLKNWNFNENEISNKFDNIKATHFINEVTYGINVLIDFYFDENNINENFYIKIFERDKIEKFLNIYLNNLKINKSNIPYKTDNQKDSENKQKYKNEFKNYKNFIKVKLIGDCIPIEYCNFISLKQLKIFFRTEFKKVLLATNQGLGVPISYSLISLENWNIRKLNNTSSDIKNESSINSVMCSKKRINSWIYSKKIINLFSDINDIEIEIFNILRNLKLHKNFFKEELDDISKFSIDLSCIKEKFEKIIRDFQCLLYNDYKLESDLSDQSQFFSSLKNFDEFIMKFIQELNEFDKKIKLYLDSINEIKRTFILFDNVNYKILDNETNLENITVSNQILKNNSIVFNIGKKLFTNDDKAFHCNVKYFKELYSKVSNKISDKKNEINRASYGIRINSIEDFIFDFIVNFQMLNYDLNNSKNLNNENKLNFYVCLKNYKNNENSKSILNIENECINNNSDNSFISFYSKNKLIYKDLQKYIAYYNKINNKLNFINNFYGLENCCLKVIDNFNQIQYLFQNKDIVQENVVSGCLLISKNFYEFNQNKANYEMDIFKNLGNEFDFINRKNFYLLDYDKLIVDESKINFIFPNFYANLKNIKNFSILIFQEGNIISWDFSKDRTLIKEILKLTENKDKLSPNYLNIYHLHKYYLQSTYILLFGSSLFHQNPNVFFQNLKFFKFLKYEARKKHQDFMDKNNFKLSSKGKNITNYINIQKSNSIKKENSNICRNNLSEEFYEENKIKNNLISENLQIKDMDEFIRNESCFYLDSDETEKSQIIEFNNQYKIDKMETKEQIKNKNPNFLLLNYDEFKIEDNEFFYYQFLEKESEISVDNKENLENISNLHIDVAGKRIKGSVFLNQSNNFTQYLKENKEKNFEKCNIKINSKNRKNEAKKEKENDIKINNVIMNDKFKDELNLENNDKKIIIDKTTIFKIFSNGDKCSDYLNFYIKEKNNKTNKLIQKDNLNERNYPESKKEENNYPLKNEDLNNLYFYKNLSDNNNNDNNNIEKKIYDDHNRLFTNEKLYRSYCILQKNNIFESQNFNNDKNFLNYTNFIDKSKLNYKVKKRILKNSIEYKSENKIIKDFNKEENNNVNKPEEIYHNYLDVKNKTLQKEFKIRRENKINSKDVANDSRGSFIKFEGRNSLCSNMDFDLTYFKSNKKVNKISKKMNTNKVLQKINYKNNQNNFNNMNTIKEYSQIVKRSCSFYNNMLQSPLKSFKLETENYQNQEQILNKNNGLETQISKEQKNDIKKYIKEKNYVENQKTKNKQIFQEKSILEKELIVDSSPETYMPLLDCNQENKKNNYINKIENHFNQNQIYESNQEYHFKNNQNAIDNFNKNAEKNIILDKMSNNNDILSFAQNKNLNKFLANPIPHEDHNQTYLNNLINETVPVSIINDEMQRRLDNQEIYKVDFLEKHAVLENDNPVCCVKIINENFIITGDSSNLKLWNIEENQVVHTFHGHTNYIYHIEVLKNESNEVMIATASSDEFIKIWDLINFSNLLTISPNIGYLSCIIKLPGTDNIIFGGDSKLKIYNFRDGIEIKQILTKSNMPYIGNIVINKDNENELFIASKFGNSNKIEKISINNELSEIFYENNSNIASLSDIIDQANESRKYYKKVLLIFGDKNGKIKLMCKETKSILQIFYGHFNRIEFLKQIHIKNSNKTFFVSCCYDNSIKIWSLDQNNFIKTLEGHHYAVWMCDELEFEDNLMIVSVSSDKKIIKWSL